MSVDDTRYTIEVQDSSVDLAEAVTKLVSEGWRPQGGVAIVRYMVDYEHKGYAESAWVWAQALVKDGRPPADDVTPE